MQKEVYAIFAIVVIVAFVGLVVNEAQPSEEPTGMMHKKVKKAWRKVEKQVQRTDDDVKKFLDKGKPPSEGEIVQAAEADTRSRLEKLMPQITAAAQQRFCPEYSTALQRGEGQQAAATNAFVPIKSQLRQDVSQMLSINTFTLNAAQAFKDPAMLQAAVQRAVSEKTDPITEDISKRVFDAVLPQCPPPTPAS